MEIWELLAREEIRDIVTRYNSNGDTGRFAQVVALFAEDAVMTTPGRTYRGKAEILTIFTGTQGHLSSESDPLTTAPPPYVRHHTSTHQIDVVDGEHATGRCYFSVVTSIGLDHWGRYVDSYVNVAGQWLFAERKVTIDGHAANSTFPGIETDAGR